MRRIKLHRLGRTGASLLGDVAVSSLAGSKLSRLRMLTALGSFSAYGFPLFTVELVLAAPVVVTGNRMCLR